MAITTSIYGAMIRRALKSRRNPATRSSTIDALLPDQRRSRSTWRRRLLRVRKLVVPAIAALLWSAAAGYGQAPADSGAAPKPGGSVEQRWPADEAAEPASPKSDQDIQPVRRETTPAPPQDQKVQPELRKAQPVEPQVEPDNRATAQSTAEPAPARKTAKPGRAAAKVATPKPRPAEKAATPKPNHAAEKTATKPKKIRRARAPSAPNSASAQQPNALSPFGFPSGGAPLGSNLSGGAPSGSNLFGASPFGGSPFGAPPAASEPAGTKRRPSAATTLQR